MLQVKKQWLTRISDEELGKYFYYKQLQTEIQFV
jgi:hypothetical protein